MSHNNRKSARCETFYYKGSDWWCGTPDCIIPFHIHPPCRYCGLSKKHLDEYCPTRPKEMNVQPVMISGLCKARADGCNKDHTKHFCGVCGNRDSSHRARNCPRTLPKEVNVHLVMISGKCQAHADGCNADHAKHFCKVCGNGDSSHRSRNCPSSNTPASMYCRESAPPPTVLKCRVAKCTENHSRHWCKKCKKNDVTHFSRECNDV